MEQVLGHKGMFCVFILFVLVADVTDAQRLKKDILEYFGSESVYYFRREWQHHRKAMEQAIANTLQETIGRDALNVLVTKTSGLKLAKAFYHTHGRVQIILNNLELSDLPSCWLPEVSFSLAAHVIKLETRLTKMVIHADYTLMRNKSDIIIDAKEQDAFKNTPFLFQPVQSMGKLALSLEGCVLSGYAIARLSGASVNLGHHKFSLTKCDYNVEIYQPGEGAPPIIARYSAKVPDNGFGIKHLVLKPLQEEFLSKMQSAIFSYVNTTAIFGQNLPALEEDQTAIFRKTLSNLTYIIRDINKNTAMLDDGAFSLEDYFIAWNDFTPYNLDDIMPPGAKSMGGIRMTNMVLTGLDTAYISNSGGPYMLDTVMVGEQIRFSSLQIRGEVFYSRLRQDQFKFALSISDFAVNIDANMEEEEEEKPAEIEIVGFRKMEFSEPRVAFKPAEGIITGHLMNNILKYINKIIDIDLTQDLVENPPVISEEEEEEDSPEEEYIEQKTGSSEKSDGGPAMKHLRVDLHSKTKMRRSKFVRNSRRNVSNNEIS